MVYLKELDARGFVIYSNWATSRKAADLQMNPQGTDVVTPNHPPHASLCFWWREQERQVRVEGHVERLSSQASQIYYDTRARGSRIGAWASRQSKVIADRQVLDEWVQEAEAKFDGVEEIPVPDFWGGIRVVPRRLEFWQGRESRLHDRFEYIWVEGQGEEAAVAKGGIQDGSVASKGYWKIQRLSP